MTEQRPLTIALVAGETSGDILGAGLIRALKNMCPTPALLVLPGHECRLKAAKPGTKWKNWR